MILRIFLSLGVRFYPLQTVTILPGLTVDPQMEVYTFICCVLFNLDLKYLIECKSG